MMDCRTFALLLDKPEREWTEQERRAAQEHAAGCPDCAVLLSMGREMREMDEEAQLPAEFSSVWRNMIRAEEQKKMKKRIFSSWKRAVAALAAVAVVGVGTTAVYLNNWGGSSKNNASQNSYRESSYVADRDYEFSGYDSGAGMMGVAMGKNMASADMAMLEDGATAQQEAQAQAEKIIRTVNFTIRTQQYEEVYEALRQLTAEHGGRVESLSVSGDGTAGNLRRASFTLRIPSARLDDFIGGAREAGSLSAYSESSEDVSESYYDMQSRLETQKAKLQRLTQMMEKADSMSDLIELEGAISEAQYWIDYYTGRMRGYDSRVNDSYVYVTLREISSAAAAEVKELGLGERIVNAVIGSLEMAGEVLQAFVIFLAAILPWLAALAAAILVVRVLVRRIRKNKKAKRQKASEE